MGVVEPLNLGGFVEDLRAGRVIEPTLAAAGAAEGIGVRP